MVGGSKISSRALHTEAMVYRYICMKQPIIQRGDWLKTFADPTSERLKFYTDKPGAPHRREIPSTALAENYYIGPVHAVARCGQFLTVIVPHPVMTDLLVFCNVWTEEPRSVQRWQPILLCGIYDSQKWDGWENVFLEMSYAQIRFEIDHEL